MLSKHTLGSLICLMGVLALTPDTLLLRKVQSIDSQTVLFYRYGFHGFTVFMYFFYKHRENTLSCLYNAGSIGFIGGILLGASNYMFTTAIHLTAVANVLVIIATSSMFSALFSWIFAREVLLLRTAVTIGVCLGAIVFIFYDQLGGSGSRNDVLGNICAVCAAVSLGSYLSLVSYTEGKLKEREIDMVSCNVTAGALIVIVAIARGIRPESVVPDGNYNPLIFLMLQGILVMPVSFTLLTIGPKYVSAPEVALFMLIETILGPLFVWLGGYEAPPIRTVYGGAVIVCALACNSVYSIRHPPSGVASLNSYDHVISSSPSDVAKEKEYIDANIEILANGDTCSESKIYDLCDSKVPELEMAL